MSHGRAPSQLGKTVSLARRQLGTARLLAAGVLGRILGRPDRYRWSDARSFKPTWEARGQLMAQLVPTGAVVVDVGSGPHGVRPWLEPSCSCVALDLVPRGPGSIVCDLNDRRLPDLAPYGPTVAVLAGVLEYVRDVPAVVDWLARHVGTFIVSYECAPPGGATVGERVWRARLGWVNSYSEEQLRLLFGQRGFACARREDWDGGDGPGCVFVFTRDDHQRD